MKKHASYVVSDSRLNIKTAHIELTVILPGTESIQLPLAQALLDAVSELEFKVNDFILPAEVRLNPNVKVRISRDVEPNVLQLVDATGTVLREMKFTEAKVRAFTDEEDED